MKTKQLFWTIVSFDGSIRNMTCSAERVAKEVMAISQFNYAEAEYDGEVYTLDRGLGNYFSLRAKSNKQEVLRILEPRSKWIDVDELAQVPDTKYLVFEESSGSPSCKVTYESYFDSACSAEEYFDYYVNREPDEESDNWGQAILYLILQQGEGSIEVIELESTDY